MNTSDEEVDIFQIIEMLRNGKITAVKLGDGTFIPADEITQVILPDGTVERIKA